MLKALFFDLDGTLLTSSKTIAPSTREALMHCRRRGMQLYVATGRSPRLDATLAWTAEELSLFDGGVFSNGACIRLDGEERWEIIPSAAVADCVALAGKHGVRLSLHLPDGSHAFNFALPESVWGPWGVTEGNIRPLDDEVLRQTVKMLFFHEHLVDSVTRLPPALLSDLNAACGEHIRFYLTDGGCAIQAAALSVSKGVGVEAIRRARGWQPEEIAVFGDDLNDLDMLQCTPHSVAMGNAVPEVQRAARYVTASNDRDGVAQAIRQMLNIR